MISKITAIIMALVSIISSLSGVLPSKQIVYNDVSYGSHERQVFDICFPAQLQKTEGVVVFIHGGGWTSGDKGSYNSRIQAISQKVGCICVSMNYRFLSKSVHCNEQLADIDAALAKIKSMAQTRGVNCTKVMLVGTSAGAQLATLYSYAKKDTAPITPCAVTAYSLPTDLSSDNFLNKNSYSSPENMLRLMSYLTGVNLSKLSESKKKATLYKYSPIKYVSQSTVPTLVVHGKLDTIVSINDTYKFINTLSSKGVTHQFIELPDSGHSLDNDKYILNKSDTIFVDFVNMYIK